MGKVVKVSEVVDGDLDVFADALFVVPSFAEFAEWSEKTSDTKATFRDKAAATVKCVVRQEQSRAQYDEAVLDKLPAPLAMQVSNAAMNFLVEHLQLQDDEEKKSQ